MYNGIGGTLNVQNIELCRRRNVQGVIHKDKNYLISLNKKNRISRDDIYSVLL
jgi:hypothetical protein